MAHFKFYIPFLPLFSMIYTVPVNAIDFMVGGNANSWKIPSYSDEFNYWAELNRFSVNDTLRFKYDNKSDSVMVVTKDSYYKCDTSNPVQHYSDGDTKIVLDRSGPFYFISGAQGHCDKGQKVIIVVLSPDHWPNPGGAVPPVEPVTPPAPAVEPVTPPTPVVEPGRNGGPGLNRGVVGGFMGMGVVGLLGLM